MYIRYAGTWEHVAAGRHCILGRRADTDDLVYAHVLPDSADLTLRDGEVEITEAEWLAGMEEIRTHNINLPFAPEPEPQPDPQAELLDALAKEWEDAAADLRAGKPDAAADALDRAAQTARGAAAGLR
jgi:hypothetical protein